MAKEKMNNFYPLELGVFGWKYYNIIKKQAINQINQEFSWSGLMMSLFIAFFISLSCATILSATYNYTQKIEQKGKILKGNRIFYIEEGLKKKVQFSNLA